MTALLITGIVLITIVMFFLLYRLSKEIERKAKEMEKDKG